MNDPYNCLLSTINLAERNVMFVFTVLSVTVVDGVFTDDKTISGFH
jgi:hypothetical protein